MLSTFGRLLVDRQAGEAGRGGGLNKYKYKIGSRWKFRIFGRIFMGTLFIFQRMSFHRGVFLTLSDCDLGFFPEKTLKFTGLVLFFKETWRFKQNP